MSRRDQRKHSKLADAEDATRTAREDAAEALRRAKVAYQNAAASSRLRVLAAR